jgi:hypothetical protein
MVLGGSVAPMPPEIRREVLAWRPAGCRFLSARSYRQRCLIDVLLVSALISILVVLAFTDLGVLAYVLTGLVFAALLLASAITNRRRRATRH